MQEIHFELGKEAQYNVFESASPVGSAPWVPILPKPDDAPDFAANWSDSDEAENAITIRED